MRYVEFKNGIQTFVTKEEQELLIKLNGSPIAKKDLTERENQVAKRLAEKSILTRQKNNDSIYYRVSKTTDNTTTY
jgi:23S rRNA maturation mini-RNase III